MSKVQKMKPNKLFSLCLTFLVGLILAACGGGGDEDGGGEALSVEPSAGTFTMVSAGADHTCGILDTGAVECWGLNDEGQSTPPAGTFTMVSAGADHTCGILDTGAVECWGLNDEGQSTPPAGTFTMVSAGADHTCGILDTGAVACWGLDDEGQSTPPAGTFTMVSAGAEHTCGILDTGAVACWGLDDEGQSTPPAGTFTMVSAGVDHTCGILDTGAVACWGLDDEGQSTPPAGTFTMVNAGADHTCGILDMGTMACWGLDDEGQSTPPMGIFTTVSAGRGHTCAVRDTGTVTCWGLDDEGQSAQSGRAPTPDLVVASPSVDNITPETGASFTLSATVSNAGDGKSSATTLRYYLSTDAKITTSDAEVGTNSVGVLSASGSSELSISVTVTAGTNYYGACVDTVAVESDTTNNCSASVQVTVHDTPPPEQDTQPPVRAPDLVVLRPNVSDSSLAAGESFPLIVTVHNQGALVSMVTTVRYYRSTDTTITTSDTELDMDAVITLVPSGGFGATTSLTAPSNPGTYYYGACVDAVTDESDTTNNCSESVTVTVAEPELQPDLIVDSFTITLGPTLETSPGALVFLNQRVANVGDATSAATMVRYYRSTDATITTSDTQVSTDAVPELAASSRFVERHNEILPTAPGTYYYGACVDAVAGESNRANNCSRPPVQVTVPAPQPDLVVTASVDDGNLNTGDSFTLSATVSNAGDEQSAASTLRYYRSTDSTISLSDTQVGTDLVGALAASGTSAESISLTAPSTADTYYYGACVDEVTDESDTTNNCSSSVTIAVEEESTGQPDLRIVGLITFTPIDGVSPGTSIGLSANVRNYGDANSDATTLRYYLSTDATISMSDTEVGTDEVSALVPSAQVAEDIDLNAPSTAGTYYYGACVDAVTGESDTTNNCSGSVQVTVSDP